MLSVITNWYRMEDLYKDKCLKIINQKGIYIVKVTEGHVPNFLYNTTAIRDYLGRDMLYRVTVLSDKYSKGDKAVLYIGKAGGVNHSLDKRIRQLVKYGAGEVKNHRGGRAIWQIQNSRDLLLGYLECEQPEIYEKKLLIEYKEKYGVLPVANWQG